MSMFNINQVFLAGNVAKDGEFKQTKTGKSVIKFSLVTNEGVKRGEQWENIPTFHDIVAWGKLGENALDYLKKGTKCTVQGKIVKRNWEHEGKKYYATEIVAEKIIVGNSAIKAVKKEDEVDQELDDVANEIPF